MARGDLVAALLQNDLLVARPFEVGQLHHQVAVGVVPLAHLARTHLQRGEGAAHDLRGRHEQLANALEALLVALTTLVRRDAHHGQHLAHARDYASDRDVVADLLRVHVADRVRGVLALRIGSEQHVVTPGHVSFQVVRLVCVSDLALLRLRTLLSMSLHISKQAASQTFNISVGVVGSSV